MPKTYTDDIAPALPSAISGPFQISDASDADSYLKIDPASAKISAAGNARPQRRLFTGLVKLIGTSVAGTLGSGMSCRQVAPGNDAGFFAGPVGVPGDMDLSEPSSIFVVIAAAVSSSLPGAVVRLEIVTGYTKDGQFTPHSTTVTYDHPVPDYWQAGAAETPRVDDGNGRTFGPDLFEAGDVLGVRARLIRSAAADTFDQAVKLASGVIFEYTAKHL